MVRIEVAGEKIEPVSSSPFQSERDTSSSVVKAGRNQEGNYANTLFGDKPSNGQCGLELAPTAMASRRSTPGTSDSISHESSDCFEDIGLPGYRAAIKGTSSVAAQALPGVSNGIV